MMWCMYSVHVWSVECRGFESQLIFLRKVTALCVLCCFGLFVCFFLPSFIKTCMNALAVVYVYIF